MNRKGVTKFTSSVYMSPAHLAKARHNWNILFNEPKLVFSIFSSDCLIKSCCRILNGASDCLVQSRKRNVSSYSRWAAYHYKKLKSRFERKDVHQRTSSNFTFDYYCWADKYCKVTTGLISNINYSQLIKTLFYSINTLMLIKFQSLVN